MDGWMDGCNIMHRGAPIGPPVKAPCMWAPYHPPYVASPLCICVADHVFGSQYHVSNVSGASGASGVSGISGASGIPFVCEDLRSQAGCIPYAR